MAKYFNISGESTQELLGPGDDFNLSKISLTNVQKVSGCSIDLYIEKESDGKYYLFKNVKIPFGATLIYDDIRFSNRTNEFGLYIKLTDGATFTLTGEIDPAASATVTGSGTAFLSEVSIGDEIVVQGETRTVTSVTTDTNLVVNTAFSNNSNDSTPDCNPTALVDVIIN